MANEQWLSEALCATETFRELATLAGARKDPSEVFFPVLETDDGKEVKPDKPAHKTYRQREGRFERVARATCAECPVRLDCLFWTMEHEQEPYGIAGGMDAENRWSLMDNPTIIEGTCQCGVKLFGTPEAIPNACSPNCRGEK